MKLKALFTGILINFCFSQVMLVHAMDHSQEGEREPLRKRSLSPSREKHTFTKKTRKDCFNFCEGKELYNTDDEKNKEIGHKSLRLIIQNDDIGFEKGHAAITLYKSDNKEDKKFGRKILHLLLQEENMVSAGIAEKLFTASRNTEDKQIARETLYDVARHPMKYYVCSSSEAYTDQLCTRIDAVNALIKNGNEQDQKIAREIMESTFCMACKWAYFRPEQLEILKMMSVRENPFQWEALRFLLRAHPTLRFLLTLHEGDNLALSQVIALFEKKNVSPEQYEEQYQTAKLINDSRHCCKAMKSIAQQKEHPRRYDAAKFLYNRNEFYANIGKKVLKEISQQENHPNQEDAKKILGVCIIL